MKNMTMYRHLAAAAMLAIPLAAAGIDQGFAKGKSCKALSVIDPDNDGSLDLAEAKKAAGEVFDRLNKDKGKDTTLDRRELRGRLSKKELEKADPDKDRTIDRAEYLAVVEVRFKAANGDKDTTIECKELGTRAGQALLRLLK